MHALTVAGLPPASLCLEVTESAVAIDPVSTYQSLRELRALGIGLALDDFGTGYSSLGALRTYPVDLIKLDRAFTEGVAHDSDSARMFEAVLGVVRAANLRAVAEGIENEAQLEFLRHAGCELAQGFLFARPLPAEEVLPLLTGATAPEWANGWPAAPATRKSPAAQLKLN